MSDRSVRRVRRPGGRRRRPAAASPATPTVFVDGAKLDADQRDARRPGGRLTDAAVDKAAASAEPVTPRASATWPALARRRSRARRRASGTSGRSRCAPTRCASSSGSSLAIWLTDRRWRARGGCAGHGRRRRAVGGAVRHRRWPASTTCSRAGSRTSATGGAPGRRAADLGRRPRHLGRRRASARLGRLDRLPPAGRSRCRRSATRSRPASPLAQAVGRWGNWFNQELFGRPTDLPWGLRDRPGAPPAAATSDVRDLPPDVPLRVAVVPRCAGILVWADRRFRLGHGRVVRALRRALHRGAVLDRDAADRRRQPHPRPPRQRLGERVWCSSAPWSTSSCRRGCDPAARSRSSLPRDPRVAGAAAVDPPGEGDLDVSTGSVDRRRRPRMSDPNGNDPSESDPKAEIHHDHQDVSGGWLRASVFGAMDGLVSNLALISGMAGGSASCVDRRPRRCRWRGGRRVLDGRGTSTSPCGPRTSWPSAEVAVERGGDPPGAGPAERPSCRDLVARPWGRPGPGRAGRPPDLGRPGARAAHAMLELGSIRSARQARTSPPRSSFVAFCLGARSSRCCRTSLGATTLLPAVVLASIGLFGRRRARLEGDRAHLVVLRAAPAGLRTGGRGPHLPGRQPRRRGGLSDGPAR